MRQAGYVSLPSDLSSPTLPRYQEGESFVPERKWPIIRVVKFCIGAIVFVGLVSWGIHQLSCFATSTSTYSTLMHPNQTTVPKVETAVSLAAARIVPAKAYTLSDTAADYGPATFIPYTYGYEMLVQKLKVFKRAQWKNIIVVDNSWDRDAWNDRDNLKEFGVIDVVVTTTHMKFSQIQSTIDSLAISLGHEYYMWTHSDVFFVSDQPSPHDMVTSCIKDRLRASPDLGILYFDYDWLSMVRVEAAKAAPWDPAMMQYAADCDRDTRMLRAGYKTVESFEDNGCPVMREQLGQFFNMPGILSDEELETVLSQDVSFDARINVINNVISNTEGYAWRGQGKGSAGLIDEKALDSYGTGGDQYYADKWGRELVIGCDKKLHYVTPNFDVPALAPPRAPPPVRPLDEEEEETSTEETEYTAEDEVPEAEDEEVVAEARG